MELILSLACDRAELRPDGKVDVEGIFNELHAPGFPARQEEMTVVFVVRWGREETGEQPLRADLLDEDDNKVLTIQGHSEVQWPEDARTPPETRLILPLEQVVFPQPGRYRFQLNAGAEVRTAFSLFVTERDEEAPNDGPDPGAGGRV